LLLPPCRGKAGMGVEWWNNPNISAFPPFDPHPNLPCTDRTHGGHMFGDMVDGFNINFSVLF
jgi:hypothetical protein